MLFAISLFFLQNLIVCFAILNYHKIITVCLLNDCFTFLSNVICLGPNVKINMTPFQLSLMYGLYCHHWVRSVINYIHGVYFISIRHHMYKDKSYHNRLYYIMDHSRTDPLTTIYFFKPKKDYHCYMYTS